MAQRLLVISPRSSFLLRSTLLCFIGSALVAGPNWAQWPEHRGNAQRTAYVEQELPVDGWQLGWCFDELSPPKPAWPAPARSSLWQQLPHIEPRVTDDQADSPVLAKDELGELHLLITSSANDRLVSIDPSTGRRRWEVVVGAPIRFAPTTAGGIAYFGSDDGSLRAVRIADGCVLWETLAGPGLPWIHGNGRLMCPHPIRTSPLWIDDRIYASAGLFPSQGVYALAVNASDGSLFWRRRLNRSPQGYSVVADGRRFILPEGRAAPFMMDAANGDLLETLPSPGGSFCMLTEQALFAGPGNLPRVESFPLGQDQRPLMKEGQPLMLPIDGRATAAGCGLIWTANRNRLICYDAQRIFQQLPDNELWAQECQLGQTIIASGTSDSPIVFVAEGPRIEIYHGRSGERLHSLSLPDESEQIFYLAVSQRRSDKQNSSPSETSDSPVATLVASCRSGKIYGWSGYSMPADRIISDRNNTVLAGLVESDADSQNNSRENDSDGAHDSPTRSLEQLLSELPVDRGLILVAGAEGESLAVDIAQNSLFHVALMVNQPSTVARLQRQWQGLGIYGHRAAVFHVPNGHSLPFENDLFNAVIALDATNTPMEEFSRVLAPGSGRMFLPGQPTAAKSIGQDLGAWRHQYASPGNEAATEDSRLNQADCFRLRWFGGVGPRNIPDRHLRGPSPLAAGPSLVVHGDECLIGVDPANGIQRWHMELPSGSTRFVMPYDCGYSALTIDGQTLYTATPHSIRVINALTGELLWKIGSQQDSMGRFNLQAASTRDSLRWGYVAESHGWLFASLMKPTAPRLSITDPATARYRYSDQDYTSIRPLVCSRSFHCLQPTGECAWSYHSGLLINSSIAFQVTTSPALPTEGNGKAEKESPAVPPEGNLVFVESTSPDCLENDTDRITLPKLMERADLVCLDLSSGAERWREPLQWSIAQNMLYTQVAGDFIILVTSSSDDADDRAHYSLRVYHRSDGQLVWHYAYPHVKKGLYHGEQVHHPVVLRPDGMEPLLVCEPYLFELPTGKRITPRGAQLDWALQRPGHSCGSLSGCGDNLFFRANNPTALNLFAGEGGQFTAVAPSRPGCWINMIPAGGQLLIPEASASCVCNFPLQTSMAFSGAVRNGDPSKKPSQCPVLLADVIPGEK